jgi:hypothetical protein
VFSTERRSAIRGCAGGRKTALPAYCTTKLTRKTLVYANVFLCVSADLYGSICRFAQNHTNNTAKNPTEFLLTFELLYGLS